MNFHVRPSRSATTALTAAVVFAAGGCGGGSGNVSPRVPSQVGEAAVTRSFGSALSTARRAPQTYKVLYSFAGGSDGVGPSGNLLDVTGTLYGTTQRGGGTGCGGNGCGTVFEITKNGAEVVVYRFKGGSDGASPVGGLLYVNGTLYGATNEGGGTGCSSGLGCGTVFDVAKSGQETVLHRFMGGADGSYPGALINVNGTLYGATGEGGSGCNGSGCGTVFKITTSGKKSSLYDFQGGADGTDPVALIDVGGKLYGTTFYGGATVHAICGPAGCGTVFKLTMSGSEQVLHSFNPNHNDGALPGAGLLDVGGTLYGTTEFGGRGGTCDSPVGGCGTVFKITTSGKESVLASFSGGHDGAIPTAGLINVRDTLYGTTSMGGSEQNKNCFEYVCGTVFKIRTSGSEYGILHAFDSSPDGARPNGGLIDVGGTLYGTTVSGGTAGGGTVFWIVNS
jgi:uncharacterized repeat protein (TIGR03803 family)